MTAETATSGQPIVCGHRGAMAIEPQNTMASFRVAQDRGATWVEFDVRPTKDGVLVIHHDPDTSDGVNVGATAVADLDSSIPRFSELVRTLPSLGLDIELKTDGTGLTVAAQVELLIAEIDEHCDNFDNLIVTSFDAEALRLVRSSRPAIPTGLLFHDRPLAWALTEAVQVGHIAIAPWIRLLTAELVEAARAADLQVATWTVNAAKDIRLAIDLGVDMIIGDDPATIVAQLAHKV